MKRLRLEQDVQDDPDSRSAPSSPLDATAQSPTSSSRRHALTAESICSLALLQPLVDDYFVYIHPLIPVPHEPTFREAFQRRDDQHDMTFLSLVACMVCTLVVSFPRMARLHVKAQGQESLFPTSMDLVDKCRWVAVEARGTGFLDKRHQINDAATSYLLGLTFGYTLQFQQNILYLTECMTILRGMGILRSSDATQYSVNCITREIGRRLFWIVVIGLQSVQHVGISATHLYIPPATSQNPYPPMALEVDDRYIFADRVDPQPRDVLSELVGFNANIRVFRSCERLEQLDLVLGIGRAEPWESQAQTIQSVLHLCKTAVDGNPPELSLLHPDGTDIVPTPKTGIGSPKSVGTPNSTRRFRPLSPFRRWETDHSSLERRRLQYEIQKANIYISQLGIRSYIVDRYWGLFDAHIKKANHSDGGLTDQLASDLSTERELIVHDLLVVLRNVSQISMEPNGYSLISKIRSITSTLLGAPGSQLGTQALPHQGALMELVEVLMKLERIPSTRVSQQNQTDVKTDADSQASDATQDWPDEDDEADFQHWADFREAQRRWADSGGVLQF